MHTTVIAARPLADIPQQPTTLHTGQIYRDCDPRRARRFILILASQKDVVICQTIGSSKISAIQRKRFYSTTKRFNYCGKLIPANGESLIRIAINDLSDKKILQGL